MKHQTRITLGIVFLCLLLAGVQLADSKVVDKATWIVTFQDHAVKETYAKQVMGFFKANKLRAVSKTLVGDSLPSLTSNYAEAVDADLIAIMSSAIDKWNVAFGSYAQQMVKSASIPLLHITPKEKQIPAGFSTFGG